jgi:hypothetical protein
VCVSVSEGSPAYPNFGMVIDNPLYGTHQFVSKTLESYSLFRALMITLLSVGNNNVQADEIHAQAHDIDA